MKEMNTMEQLLSIPKQYMNIILNILDKCNDIDAIKEMISNFDKQCYELYWSKFDVQCVCSTDKEVHVFRVALQSSAKAYMEEVIGSCPISSKQHLSDMEMLCCYMGVAWTLYSAPYLKPKFSRSRLLSFQYTISKWFMERGYKVRMTEEKLYTIRTDTPFGIYTEIGFWRLFGEEYHDLFEWDNRLITPQN